MFGKLITSLSTTALFVFSSAAFSDLAVADDAANPAVDLERGEQLFDL